MAASQYHTARDTNKQTFQNKYGNISQADSCSIRRWPESCSIPEEPPSVARTLLWTLFYRYDADFWILPILQLLALAIAAANGLALAVFKRMQGTKAPVYPLQVRVGVEG